MSETVTNNIDSSASSPGSILKRCREYHGISLDEAAEATKVGLNYLKALEEDKTGEFASLAYLKGFLRIYASYLGLNPDDIMRLYDKMSAPVGLHGPGQSADNGKGDALRRHFSWQKLALPVCLLLLLIITATIIGRPTKSSLQREVPKQAAVIPPPPAVMPSRSSAGQVPLAQEPAPAISPASSVKQVSSPPEHISVKQQSAPPKGFVVRMKVTQNGTLAVTIDGATTQNYDLTAGDIIEWKAENNITLDISNAGGVEAELNGKSLSSFGPVGKPVYIVLDADGIKQ